MPENRDERGENVSCNAEIKDLSCQIVEGLSKQRAGQTESEKSDVAQDVAEELHAVVKPEERCVNHFERVESLCLDRIKNNKYSRENFKRKKSVCAYRSGVSRIENGASALIERIPEEERPDAAYPRDVDERSNEIFLVLGRAEPSQNEGKADVDHTDEDRKLHHEFRRVGICLIDFDEIHVLAESDERCLERFREPAEECAGKYAVNRRSSSENERKVDEAFHRRARILQLYLEEKHENEKEKSVSAVAYDHREEKGEREEYPRTRIPVVVCRRVVDVDKVAAHFVDCLFRVDKCRDRLVFFRLDLDDRRTFVFKSLFQICEFAFRAPCLKKENFVVKFADSPFCRAVEADFVEFGEIVVVKFAAFCREVEDRRFCAVLLFFELCYSLFEACHIFFNDDF